MLEPLFLIIHLQICNFLVLDPYSIHVVLHDACIILFHNGQVIMHSSNVFELITKYDIGQFQAFKSRMKLSPKRGLLNNTTYKFLNTIIK